LALQPDVPIILPFGRRVSAAMACMFVGIVHCMSAYVALIHVTRAR
jgi:hypothetical protein